MGRRPPPLPMPPPHWRLQHEPRRIRTETPPDRTERTTATGATIRLLKRCRACGDALPPDAKFCIMCRAPVQET